MVRGLVVFGITYALIATGRLRFVRMDRPAGALVGAVLAVAVGALTPEEAARAVDKSTIILLFAVMGMSAFLSLDGFFDRVTGYVAARVRTRRGLLAVLVWGAGALSAVVTNDAVCVLGAPLVVGWIRRFGLPRLPYLLALATAANTGSVATLVGNPQNMLCGSLGGLHFAPFLGHLGPVALLGLAANHALLLLSFRRDLEGELPPAEPFVGRLFRVRTGATVLVLVATVVAYSAGANMPFTALGGFAVLLLVHRSDPEEVWSRIDWSVLLFFGALFVAVDAFARSGAARWGLDHLALGAGLGDLGDAARAAGIFLVGSNVVTNVPFILIVQGDVHAMRGHPLPWELLAMASTFAGNLTLLGSVANVIVAEKGAPVGGLRFGEYLRVGAPIALVTTALGTLWLWLVR